ncbi:MAG: SpoIID/LytB domain-containing protein, partial [Candidatus Omnitrophica bacterium]|nr:SpoIID/LytB domain-containing protein [Candidatus Omnitrophota bacterium]
QEEKYVRVLILKDKPTVSFKINGSFEIDDAQSGKVLYRGKNLKAAITAQKNGISIGKTSFKSNKVLLRPDDPEAVYLESRKFRGNLVFVRNGRRLSVINHIKIDDYVSGVLIYEASHYWPTEALKAMVLVVRTFALYQAGENAVKDYDLTSDIYSQVYGGRIGERYRLNEAVEQTKGLILTYQGKILPSFHHATCAGHTEDSAQLWNIDLPPLKGVPCDFCKESPHYNWHQVSEEKEIREKLIGAGYDINKINEIVILGKNPSGRIKNLRIISDKKDITISCKDFRNIIGPNIIKSTNFSVSLVNGDVVFVGLGWGHGVGLCQWGAYFMAKKGYSYEQIIEYYFPGSKLSGIK